MQGLEKGSKVLPRKERERKYYQRLIPENFPDEEAIIRNSRERGRNKKYTFVSRYLILHKYELSL